MNFHRPSYLICMFALALVATAARAADYHHVHLRADDPKAAVAWYGEYMDGEAVLEGRSPRAMFGTTLIIFFPSSGAFEPSAGSVVDHIGFSFKDLDAKMTEFKAAGIKVLAEPRQVMDFKFAFIEDPWGTKIEVMQDPELYGFHHIHLMVPDQESTVKWYADTFGGVVGNFKNIPSLQAVRYGDVWLIVSKGAEGLAPTKGRSMDHLGWAVPDLDAAAATIKGKGITFDVEPMDFANLRISFITDPNGVYIEIVQPPS